MLVGQTIGSGPYRFDILSEVGSGAMGTVYKATFHKDGKTAAVALKVVSFGLLGNDSAMARFDREASILKQLRHPHIVRLYATGHYKRTPFIAMEFVEGEPLDRALVRRGKLSWEEVAAHGRQLCEALRHAHEKGIIHRDLKPSNLMINEAGVLKLTDFGIAKDTDVTALTGANSTIGTAAYMSPEQCKGERNLTPKSDLYSLGVVFFELLSGRKPFAAETTVEMFMKHVNEAPPRVGKVVPGLPAKFEQLILQLLEKDKDDRPTDAAWVGRMLAEVEEDAFARKSAGLGVATARRADRRPGAVAQPLTEADREAARALRGMKKGKKRPAGPWYGRPAVRAAGLVAALLALAAVAYVLLQPPSAAALAAAVDAAPTPKAKAEAAEAYLRKYGDVPGEATDRATAAFRDGKARDLEGVLARRFTRPVLRADPEGEDPAAYATAMAAIQGEADGRLADAAVLWGQVRKQFPDEAKLPFTLDDKVLAKARMAWAAERRVKEIDAVKARTAELEVKIGDAQRYDKATAYDPAGPESAAIRALRLERVPDPDKASRAWDAVAGLTEKDPDLRVWYLLATSRRAGLPKPTGDIVGGRREAVGKKLAEAEKQAAELKAAGTAARSDWVLLRIALREVAELYDDETDRGLADAAGRAKRLLAEVAKEG